MATYVLIHGAGSDAWYWHLVTPQLEARGHDVVAVDLPCDDDSAGLDEYTDVVVDAIGDRRDVDRRRPVAGRVHRAVGVRTCARVADGAGRGDGAATRASRPASGGPTPVTSSPTPSTRP